MYSIYSDYCDQKIIQLEFYKYGINQSLILNFQQKHYEIHQKLNTLNLVWKIRGELPGKRHFLDCLSSTRMQLGRAPMGKWSQAPYVPTSWTIEKFGCRNLWIWPQCQRFPLWKAISIHSQIRSSWLSEAYWTHKKTVWACLWKYPFQFNPIDVGFTKNQWYWEKALEKIYSFVNGTQLKTIKTGNERY